MGRAICNQEPCAETNTNPQGLGKSSQQLLTNCTGRAGRSVPSGFRAFLRLDFIEKVKRSQQEFLFVSLAFTVQILTPEDNRWLYEGRNGRESK